MPAVTACSDAPASTALSTSQCAAGELVRVLGRLVGVEHVVERLGDLGPLGVEHDREGVGRVHREVAEAAQEVDRAVLDAGPAVLDAPRSSASPAWVSSSPQTGHRKSS